MDKRHLGDTGIMVSPYGLGTTKFGRNEGVKYPESFDLPSLEDLADLLSIAKELGVNVIDCAPAYGVAEERLGMLLKGQRKDWVIVGKVGEEFEDGVSSHNFSVDHFERSLARSLERLGTDYLDVLMIHSDGNDMDILNDDALIEIMHDFKRRGLVRTVGASTKTVDGGIKALELMDVVMASYNPDYADEKPVLDYAAEHNKGVFLKKVLSSGHNVNTADAFNFALSHKGAACAVVGSINVDHLKNNIEAVNASLRA